MQDRSLNQVLYSMCEEAGALSTGFILMLIAGAIRDNSFTIGDFAFFVTCLDSFTMLIVEAGGFTTRFKQAGVAFRRLMELMEMRTRRAETGRDREGGRRIVGGAPADLSAKQLPTMTMPEPAVGGSA